LLQVPRTLHQALSTFFTNPSPLLILLGIAGLLAWRARSPLHPAADLAVPAAVAAWWCLQEWVVHALLLHSKRDWLGSRIHIGHHKKPYYHVSPRLAGRTASLPARQTACLSGLFSAGLRWVWLPACQGDSVPP
jgi:hypothetical protein